MLRRTEARKRGNQFRELEKKIEDIVEEQERNKRKRKREEEETEIIKRIEMEERTKRRMRMEEMMWIVMPPMINTDYPAIRSRFSNTPHYP